MPATATPAGRRPRRGATIADTTLAIVAVDRAAVDGEQPLLRPTRRGSGSRGRAGRRGRRAARCAASSASCAICSLSISGWPRTVERLAGDRRRSCCSMHRADRLLDQRPGRRELEAGVGRSGQRGVVHPRVLRRCVAKPTAAAGSWIRDRLANPVGLRGVPPVDRLGEHRRRAGGQHDDPVARQRGEFGDGEDRGRGQLPAGARAGAARGALAGWGWRPCGCSRRSASRGRRGTRARPTPPP